MPDKRFTAYTHEKITWGSQMTINMQLLLRVRSSIKLGATSREGYELIDTSDRKATEAKEDHFMQVETVVNTYKIDYLLVKQFFKQWRDPTWEFNNWTITDFDHTLKGNPIIKS
jgi:hypothetical protein